MLISLDQEIGGLGPMAEIATSSDCSRQQPAAAVGERKTRPQKDQALNCPRCHSTNTKFCYYNNYSLTQPRYFCKTCRRYWTEGGTLRNVPVGGGSRKNKRSTTTTTTATTTTSSHKLPDLNPPNIPHFASGNPNKIMNEGQDLNLGFPGSLGLHQHASQFFELPKIIDHGSSQNQLNSSSSGNSSSTSSTPFAALELLRTGLASRGMNSFITSGSPAPDYSGFFFQDLRPAAVSFSVDGLGNSRYVVDSSRGIQENGGRQLMFPFGTMKPAPAPSSSEVDQNNKGQISNSNGFWNGMLGGGSW